MTLFTLLSASFIDLLSVPTVLIILRTGCAKESLNWLSISLNLFSTSVGRGLANAFLLPFISSIPSLVLFKSFNKSIIVSIWPVISLWFFSVISTNCSSGGLAERSFLSFISFLSISSNFQAFLDVISIPYFSFIFAICSSVYDCTSSFLFLIFLNSSACLINLFLSCSLRSTSILLTFLEPSKILNASSRLPFLICLVILNISPLFKLSSIPNVEDISPNFLFAWSWMDLVGSWIVFT